MCLAQRCTQTMVLLVKAAGQTGLLKNKNKSCVLPFQQQLSKGATRWAVSISALHHIFHSFSNTWWVVWLFADKSLSLVTTATGSQPKWSHGDFQSSTAHLFLYNYSPTGHRKHFPKQPEVSATSWGIYFSIVTNKLASRLVWWRPKATICD